MGRRSGPPPLGKRCLCLILSGKRAAVESELEEGGEEESEKEESEEEENMTDVPQAR